MLRTLVHAPLPTAEPSRWACRIYRSPTLPRHDRETRQRLSGPGLRAFLAIAERWGLNEDDRQRVLAAPSPAAYDRWVQGARSGETLVLPTGVLLRLAAVLTVHRLLRQVFGGGPEALDWLRAPHDAPPFGGRPPLALMTGGTLEGLDAACRYLDALTQGHPAAPGIPGPPSPDVLPGKKR